MGEDIEHLPPTEGVSEQAMHQNQAGPASALEADGEAIDLRCSEEILPLNIAAKFRESPSGWECLHYHTSRRTTLCGDPCDSIRSRYRLCRFCKRGASAPLFFCTIRARLNRTRKLWRGQRLTKYERFLPKSIIEPSELIL